MQGALKTTGPYKRTHQADDTKIAEPPVTAETYRAAIYKHIQMMDCVSAQRSRWREFCCVCFSTN